MIRMRYLCKNSLGLQHSVAPHFVNSSSSSFVSIRGLFSSTDIFFFSSHWVRHREVLVTNHMIFKSKNRLVLSNTFILIKFIKIIVIIYSIIETVWFSTSNFGVHKNMDLKKNVLRLCTHFRSILSTSGDLAGNTIYLFAELWALQARFAFRTSYRL